jgi:hypothetical protein
MILGLLTGREDEPSAHTRCLLAMRAATPDADLIRKLRLLMISSFILDFPFLVPLRIGPGAASALL